VIRDFRAGVGSTRVLGILALNDDGLGGKASLLPQDTAGSSLAGQAMANRDAHGLPGNGQLQLAATA